jgi:hypothetical protein
MWSGQAPPAMSGSATLAQDEPDTRALEFRYYIMRYTTMDPATIERHLAKAEAHVVLGAEHIAKQQQFVSELDPDGGNLAEARRFLDNLISAQTLYVAHRDKLLNEFRTLPTGGTTANPDSREHAASRTATRSIEQNDEASMADRQASREDRAASPRKR